MRVKPYSAEAARKIASDIKDRLGKEGVGVGYLLSKLAGKTLGD
ncbi:MAG: hypothetical protein U0401_19775 [Anaerolineae bacterium]